MGALFEMSGFYVRQPAGIQWVTIDKDSFLTSSWLSPAQCIDQKDHIRRHGSPMIRVKYSCEGVNLWTSPDAQ